MGHSLGTYMMAGLNALGFWLVVTFVGVTHSYLTKTASSPYSGEGTDQASTWEAPLGEFAHVTLESSTPSDPSSQVAPYGKPQYAQPNAQMGLVPAAPSPQVYGGSPQAPPNQNFWAISPPSPFSDGFPPANEQGFLPEPHPPAFSHEIPSSHMLSFRPGEMTYVEKIYDRGIYNGESEAEGPTFQYVPVRIPYRVQVGSPLFGPPVGGFLFGYPHDYMMMPASIPYSQRLFMTKAMKRKSG